MRGIFTRTAIIAAAGLSGSQASATIFYSNYAPSDTTKIVQQTPIPNDYRLPSADQSFGATASLGAYCSPICFSFYSAVTEFTATSSFSASRIILPMYRGGSFGNFRIGIGLERYDAGSTSWVSIGGGQFESGNVPGFQNSEIEVPFGASGARFEDFSHQPIAFATGDRYRLTLGYGTGAAGDMQWYLSDQAATPGQSTEYWGGSRFSQANSRALSFQPAFALTDGGALVNAVMVPEPAVWALMAFGFGLTGAALRRRRAVPMAA